MHSVSACCRGEICSMCGKPATHKVEEFIFHDAYPPNEVGIPSIRHPLTAYICCAHFVQIMGAAANRDCQVVSKVPEVRKQRYLRATIRPGIFSCERIASFKIHDRLYCCEVDEQSVHNDGYEDYLEIYLLQDMGEGKVRIQLPRETTTTGSQIVVPWDYIV